MISGVLTVVFVFSALMLGGFTGAWAIWPTAYRHGYAEGESDRHRHRAGARQETTLLELPRAGRLEPLPDLAPIDPVPLGALTATAHHTPWVFAGGWDQGPLAGPAERDLLAQTAEQPASSVEGEPPIDTGELLAITDRVESWIAQWTAQGNVDRHTIQAGD